MSFAALIREVGRGQHGSRDLSEDDAYRVYGAMLDGGMPDLELGGLTLALRMKTESLSELLGFHRAVQERLGRLQAHTRGPLPVVIATYNGARRQPNLTPLLALLLKRFGIPVLVHGELSGHGERIASAYVFRELGILPCASLAHAQQAMDGDGLAFVPTAALSAGLAALLALRSRLGVRNSAHTLVKLMDPFHGESLRICSATHPAYLAKMREFFAATGERALVLRGAEGEPYANPKRRPQLEFFQNGASAVLFDAEVGSSRILPSLPAAIDAPTTAAWIKRALEGTAPLPLPIVNQLACCLYGAGYTHDLSQAKTIVASETNSLAAA